jgi:hypothetical protein
MKKLAVLFSLFSILIGYSQNNSQPTQATDWNSTRSNKTSKTTRVINPQENENTKVDKKIRQLGMIIERIPSKGPNVYVSMPDKELTVFNKLPNQEKKLYFSTFISKIIKRINPEEKIDKEDIMQATLAKWCGPCPLISAQNDGGIIKIKKNDFVYKIYFSKGERNDVEEVVIKDKTEGTNDPSFAISPEDEDGGGGGFCYRPLNLNIDTTLEPIPEVEDEFCMDDSATQRVGNKENNKDKFFFYKRSIKNNSETQSKDTDSTKNTSFHNKYRPQFRKANPNQGKGITLSLSSGISTPSSNFSTNAYAKNGSYFDVSGAYYFSKFGFGVSIGQLSNATDNSFSNAIISNDISTTNTTQNWKQFYYGIGPEYKTQFGNFSATFSTKIGLQSVKSINLESNYSNGDTPIAILKIKSDKSSSLSYFSTDLKFGYNLSSNFNLYATVNYMSSLSKGISTSTSKISDTNRNGIIDAEDLKFATGSGTIDYETSTQNIKPQSINFGIGISYIFHSKKGYEYYKAEADNTSIRRKKPGRTKYSDATLKSQANGDGNGEDNTVKREKRKAKKECLSKGGSFWENADGSYSCIMHIQKSKKVIKIPRKIANELAHVKKLVLADKTKQGVIEITVVYPLQNKTAMVSISPEKTKDAETILQQVLETTQGNGDDKGKVKIRYVAKL